MLLSLLRLTRWSGRRLAVSLLALTYAWAFVALDITHVHPLTVTQAGHGPSLASSAASADQHTLSHGKAGTPEAPCPICAAVHAAAVALAPPPVPVRLLVPPDLLVARPIFFVPTADSSTLHLRGPPQA